MKEITEATNSLPYYFSSLTWAEAEEVIKEDPLLLLPIGTVEPHGPHGPLNTDLIISSETCIRASRKLRNMGMETLILPSVNYAVADYASCFPGSISISEDGFKFLVKDICLALINQGFSKIFFINNHFEPEHIKIIYSIIDNIRKISGVQICYLDLTRKERAELLGEEFKSGECHAGSYETSLVMASDANLIREKILNGLPYVPINLVEVIDKGMKDFKQMGLNKAYCGSPAKASIEEGNRLYDTIVDFVVDSAVKYKQGSYTDAPGFYGNINT